MGFVMTKGPLFQHDCQTCMFLGVWQEADEKKPHDIYFCPGEDSVIARYGDDGPEYASSPIQTALCANPDYFLSKVAKWILHEDLVKVVINKPWIRKKRRLNEGWWKLRKGQEYMG